MKTWISREFSEQKYLRRKLKVVLVQFGSSLAFDTIEPPKRKLDDVQRGWFDKENPGESFFSRTSRADDLK